MKTTIQNDFPLDSLRRVTSHWGTNYMQATVDEGAVARVDGHIFEDDRGDYRFDAACLLDMAIINAELRGSTTILLAIDGHWEVYQVETFDQWQERHEVCKSIPGTAAHAQLLARYKSGLHFCDPDLLVERWRIRDEDYTSPVTPEFFLRNGMVEQAVRLAALRGYSNIGIGVDYGRGAVHRETTLRDFKVVDGEIYLESMANGLPCSPSTVNAPASEVAAAYRLKVNEGGHWWMTVS